ncbi:MULTISPECIES: LPS export ABC transporter periplasmic protein LptC [Idiomarinaceae]|uniref:Lipopolysaccharide export system protein LptC n=1 Tax=Pseudidiomarina fusca TaxID=2965078 RepID=A0ABU3KX27_9GAMM|nr:MULTISPECIES: LPS export ABC transporter periplasmic protein LptC [Idiomarinaceae]MDT7525904.1 LPS export ABC transporter periplasmic protein LptC [Pseudidiomarina sp. GXY010]MRJ42012.1 LPS export ABC transporter periplasmic protein LptC [Idiomarina sp. FeN1]NCU57295.1 LPS export ABC transporter periplasmic protein LptC [Idiomarina sp. FenA--70]NCU60003.1 LPS export ABC transporter periplasmic protein LptC [Idiomarina sp. FenBw--71]UUN12914.1 LPS export ABC transporter periplasmic protein L
MTRNLVVIIAIIFATLALLVWRPFGDQDLTDEPAGYREIKPDFTAQGLIVRVYSEDGTLAHRIAAEKMTHYSPIGLTELDQPTYIVHTRDGGPVWQVAAEAGSFYGDKSLVLERNILMRSLTAEDFLERVETSYLTIDTLAETMTTEQAVVMYGRDFTIRGEGMHANLRAQTLELTKHVETIYTGRHTNSQ